MSTAACVQLDSCIPRFALQEYTGESDPPKGDLLVEPLQLKEGYLIVPEAPGLEIILIRRGAEPLSGAGQGTGHARGVRRVGAGPLIQ
ncbi:MAG: enolase C-terminal domain-like protein [Candidatus Latescibacterota bacterium]|nr:enolase C-terminal domain-like protein [Candidatus Latescibacterota bacterium]